MIMPRVAIFRTTWSPDQEPFITIQALAMARYLPTVLTREARRKDDALPICEVPAPDRLAARLGSAEPYRRLWEGQRPDIVHAHFGPDGVMAMPLAKAWDCPLVVTFHGFDATMSNRSLLFTKKPTNWAYVAGRPRLRSTAHRFVAVSGFIANKLEKLGFDPTRIRTIHTGIDPRRFHAPGGEWHPRRTIVAVARHIEFKGLDVLIRAHAALAVHRPDLRLTLVGRGPLTQALAALAADLGTASLVDFIPFVNQSDLPQLYAKALALVLPSRHAINGHTEGLGMVLLEAAACGTPVIGSRVGGIPEAVDEGRTGLLVSPDDPGELARALMFLAEDEERARQMGAAGVDWVARNFDVTRQTAKLELLYDEVRG